MATLNSIDLGKLQSESTRVDSGVIPMPLPDSLSSETILIPLLGPTSTYTITGRKGGSFADAQTFIAQLKTWVTEGGQISKPNIDFVGELNPGPISVRVINGSWTAATEEPFIVNYTLEMIEGVFS